MAALYPGKGPLFEEARELASRTEGWLTGAEGKALFVLASRCRPPGVIVEIGSWKGKSTTWLAMGSRSGSGLKVCSVDPHGRHGGVKEVDETFKEFAMNIRRAGIQDLVVPYVMTSVEAVPKIKDDVALVFVDGNHQYEWVKLDAELWFPKLVNGGHLAFHDAVGNGHGGVHRAVREVVYESGRFRNVRLVGSMTICEKDGGRPWQRFRTRWALVIFEVSDLPLERYLPRRLLLQVQRVLRKLQ